ncbi:MAG: sugar ABC transporter ATP-binding protein [Lachnospiraceae bacterium]|nr:sugar ABC transporter ATP-binding protein [Lachnospiraceae bacterium]
MKRFNKEGDENLDNKVIVELKNIRKEFPGVTALDQVNMKIREGTIHALVGENGAGKSTLMKVLSGTYQNYEGQVICNEKEIHMKSEKDAFSFGISIVAQELNYVPELTIAENLFLGREPERNKWFINKKERSKRTKELLDLMGLDYEPEIKMDMLSVAQRQMIEILKSISRNSKVIIMDEPTSALTSKESELLFNKVKELKQKGIAFVFISHRLDEIFEICDEYTVLRDGRCIQTGELKDVDTDKLISLMVGRNIDDIYPKIPDCQKEKMLKVHNLTNEPYFKDVSFEIKKGEILGFAGMMGAGRSEIARAVFGMDKKDSGEMILEGKKLDFKNANDAIKAGVAMITEDRAVYGFAGVRSIKENIKLPNGDLYTKFGFWKEKETAQNTKKICEKLRIKAPDINTLVGTLSGGNQQKVVLAKWLVRNIKVLILDEPTRGIDVGAKQEIYKLIVELAQKGMAILLISSDMPEVLSMSHRVAVIAHGKLVGTLDKKEASQDKIMKMIVEAK